MNRDTPTPPDRGTPTPSRTSSGGSRINLLPEDFSPGDDDVICGRGKKCYTHVGNERFRLRVTGMLEEYSRARSKLDKSSVLNAVVEQVRLTSPSGGFVKQDENGRWYEVGDFLAREKTSQAFRDALHEHYKSSNVSKKKRRQEEQAKATDKMQKYARAEFDMAARLRQIARSRAEAFGTQNNMDPLNRLNALQELRNEQGTSPYTARDASFQFTGHHSCSSIFQPQDNSFQSVADSHLMHSFSDVVANNRFNVSANDVSGGIFSRRSRPRSYSLPSSPQNVPSFELEFEPESEELHHSLPNVHLNTAAFGQLKHEPINECETMHHSLPDMTYNTANRPNSHNSSISSEYDPLPISSYTSGQLQQRLQQEAFITRPVAVLKGNSGSSGYGGMSGGMSAFSKRPPLAPSSSGDEVSKDFLSCLEKLTESTITDDNPFEPIPITPKTSHKSTIGMSLLARKSASTGSDPTGKSSSRQSEDDPANVIQAPMLLTPPSNTNTPRDNNNNSNNMEIDINREMFKAKNPPPFTD